MKWPSRPNQLNAMNLILNLTITPKVLLTRTFMRFMALLCVLSTCLRTGLSIPNAKINKIWYVNQVNLDNTEKLSYKSMQMWYTYELSEMLLSYREYCTHLYMISPESPSSMTFGYGVRVLYCTFIWSQLTRALQATWRMAWGAFTVPVYDLSWVSIGSIYP